MKSNLILFTVALAIVFLTGVLAVDRMQGDINLVWSNYGSQPQNFAGTVSGDLVGTIDLTANVDYDSTYTSIGNTVASITANLNSVDCEGTAYLSNINFGTDKGTFFLACGNDLIQGTLSGKNAQNENGDWTLFNLVYDGFKVVPIKGDKGDTGSQGLQGEQGIAGTNGQDGANGIDGTNGLNGIDGKDGLNGADGKDGLNGVDGKSAYQIWIDLSNSGTENDFIASLKGLKGDTGSQGIQGETGLQGLKGDTGEQGIQGLKGDKGDKGDTGLTGLQGPQGFQGVCSCSEQDVLDIRTKIDLASTFPSSPFSIWIKPREDCRVPTTYTCIPAPSPYSHVKLKSIITSANCLSGFGNSSSCVVGKCTKYVFTSSKTCYRGICDATNGTCS